MSEPARGDQVENERHVVVVGPDGKPVGTARVPAGDDEGGQDVTDLVEQPAKVMRIGAMTKQLLDEVRHAPLDEAGRARLREIYETSVRELADGLSPDLRAELDRRNALDDYRQTYE